nr:hypothetical protein Q903MT_gene4543 [Picea sitchensis]
MPLWKSPQAPSPIFLGLGDYPNPGQRYSRKQASDWLVRQPDSNLQTSGHEPAESYAKPCCLVSRGSPS